MGPGMFDDLWKGMLFLLVVAMLAAGACGWGVARCSSIYRVHIERAPASAPRGEGANNSNEKE